MRWSLPGKSPRQAALKAANRGYTDIRLRERGTKKVHVFTGERVQVDKPKGAPDWMPEKIWKPKVKKVGVEKRPILRTQAFYPAIADSPGGNFKLPPASRRPPSSLLASRSFRIQSGAPFWLIHLYPLPREYVNLLGAALPQPDIRIARWPPWQVSWENFPVKTPISSPFASRRAKFLTSAIIEPSIFRSIRLAESVY